MQELPNLHVSALPAPACCNRCLDPHLVTEGTQVCAAAFNTEKRMMHTTAFQCLRTRLGENCRGKGSHCRGKLTWGCSVACKPLPALGPDQCSVQERK